MSASGEGDFTQQEERVRRRSVGVPYWRSSLLLERVKKKDKRDGSRSSYYNPRRERGRRACFPKPAINLEERDVIPAPVKVSTIFTCAKCESALLALWRSLLAAGPSL